MKNVIGLLSSRRRGLQQVASFFVLLAAVAALAAPGCNSSDNGTPSGPAACNLTSDCAKGLTCALGRCRTQCTTSVDCTTGGPGDCVVDITTGLAVCVPKNAPCEKQSECRAPLACASDYRCRNLCTTDDDCNLFGTHGRICAVDANMVKFCADKADVSGMASGGMIATAPPSTVKTDAGVAPPSAAMIAMDLPDAAAITAMQEAGGMPDSTTGMGDSTTMGMPDSTTGMGDSTTMGMPDGGPPDTGVVTMDAEAGPPMCEACGSTDAVCCPGDPCKAGLVCNPTTKKCECGKANEPCCNISQGTGTCSPGLSCVTPMAGGVPSCICGQLGTKCCPASSGMPACSGNSACAGVKCGCVAEFQSGTSSGGSPGLVRRVDGTVWKASNYAPMPNQNIYLQVVTMASAPLRVSTTATEALAISGSYTNYLGCVVVTGGTVMCFPLADKTDSSGSTYLGAGLGQSDVTASPVTVVTDTTNFPALPNIVQIAGGTQSTPNFCAVDTAGNAWCWGYGQNGQLGNGDTSNANIARKVKVDAVTALANVAEVRVGYESACARLTDGTVWCWGTNSQAELGQPSGTLPFNYYPVQVHFPGTAKPTRLAAGPSQTHCALMNDTTVNCWGYNPYSEAGVQTDPTHQTVDPSTVPAGTGTAPLTGVIDLAAGYYSTCAKTAAPDYAIVCWGNYNSSKPYPKPFVDNMQTAVTGIRSVLSSSGYYGYISYVDPNGSVSSNGTPADSMHEVPCTNLGDGGP